jgi:4-aminobutyrate aminotransferase/(S)-3-amino-2-methylpropionate transaminase
MKTAASIADRSAGLAQRRERAVTRGVASAFPIFAERAEGARLWDVDGREYIDFAAGIGTLNLGHRHPRVTAAIAEQAQRFLHTCFQVVPYEGYVELAERLNRIAPGDFEKKTLLLTTGAEATENAIKIARAATGRPGVVAFHWGYHGRTLLALTMTGKVAPYRQAFGPWAPDVYHAPFPYALHGWDTRRALAALREMFDTEVSPQRVAAIIIEPVLGEGGFVPAPLDFLRELRAIADAYGIVLVADEIQTGFGRTGSMFAIEQAGVAPDLMTIAKSLAGGLPLAAVVGRAELMDAVEPGGLGGTFAGNPLACAAALATLDVFEDEPLLERAREIGRRVRARLDALAARHSQVAEVRGLGAMLGIELHDAPADPDGRNAARRIVDDAARRGLLVITAGPKGNTLRLLIPLVAGDDDLSLGLDRLDAAFAAVLDG